MDHVDWIRTFGYPFTALATSKETVVNYTTEAKVSLQSVTYSLSLID